MASKNTPARRNRGIQSRKDGAVEGTFQHIDTLRLRERRTEIARRYYPSGRLEAERLRVKETERRDPLTLPAERKQGCLSFFGTVFGGGVVFFLVGLAGALFVDAWWGPFASIFLFSIVVVLWDL